MVQNANLQLWKWLLCPQMLNGMRAVKADRIQGSCRAGCFTEKQDQLIDAIISAMSKQSSHPTHQHLRKVCRHSSHCASRSCSAAVRGHLPFKGYGLVVRESRGLGSPTYCPTLRKTPIDREMSASALWTCRHRASWDVGVRLQIESSSVTDFTHMQKARSWRRSTPLWADKTGTLDTEEKIEVVWKLFVPHVPPPQTEQFLQERVGDRQFSYHLHLLACPDKMAWWHLQLVKVSSQDERRRELWLRNVSSLSGIFLGWCGSHSTSHFKLCLKPN